MKKIKLKTKTKKPVYVLVDDKDYFELSKYSWFLKTDKRWEHNKYAVRFEVTIKNGKRKTKSFRMHRQILNASKDVLTDHKNGNGLDNRRKNLRFCNFSENSQSCRSHRKSKTSKYKGVYWHKDKNKWQVRVSYNGKEVYLGLYSSEMEAARVHDIGAKLSYGKFAVLNFKKLSTKHLKNVKKRLKAKKSKTSKYRGVAFYAQTDKWTAQISYKSKYCRLGYFATEKEAALAYNKKAKELLGDKAILNKID
jgi:hypothetical protein